MMNGCPRWSFLTVPLLAALGCSDPVPRPPQGNVTLSVQKPNGANCPLPGKVYEIGNPNGPTEISAGDRLIDGEHNAAIKCSVKGSGPFTFSGTVQGPSKEADKVTFTISAGTINTDKVSGTATVSVYTPQLADTFFSPDGACTVTVIGQQVKPGSVWAKVSCPTITAASTGQVCGVGASTTFVLENCDGS